MSDPTVFRLTGGEADWHVRYRRGTWARVRAFIWLCQLVGFAGFVILVIGTTVSHAPSLFKGVTVAGAIGGLFLVFVILMAVYFGLQDVINSLRDSFWAKAVVYRGPIDKLYRGYGGKSHYYRLVADGKEFEIDLALYEQLEQDDVARLGSVIIEYKPYLPTLLTLLTKPDFSRSASSNDH